MDTEEAEGAAMQPITTLASNSKLPKRSELEKPEEEIPVKITQVVLSYYPSTTRQPLGTTGLAAPVV
jgi:hypothetical protein